MYRIRQTGFFAFVLGVLVADWKWVVLILFLFFGGLWLWSAFREDQKSDEEVEELPQPDIPIRRFRVTHADLRGMPTPTPIDLLMDQGFDPRLPFSYYDDPLTEQRVYTQEILECTCRSGPNGNWIVGRACPLHGMG